MNIPAIGAARGIFEMFVPGAFVILNVLVVAYSMLDSSTQSQIRELASNSLLSLVILICFGYLVGVIMRLFRTETPDKWSSILYELFLDESRARSEKDKKWLQATATEEFPYIEWLGSTHNFPLGRDGKESTAVKDFYNRVWAIQLEGKDDLVKTKQKQAFFNFCKVLINTVDERAATEIYSLEAFNRYLTGMFYSLLITLPTMIIGLIIRLTRDSTDMAWVLFLIMFFIYLAMLLAILWNYRISRLREVSTVFTATYHHRELFEPAKVVTPADKSDKE